MHQNIRAKRIVDAIPQNKVHLKNKRNFERKRLMKGEMRESQTEIGQIEKRQSYIVQEVQTQNEVIGQKDSISLCATGQSETRHSKTREQNEMIGQSYKGHLTTKHLVSEQIEVVKVLSVQTDNGNRIKVQNVSMGQNEERKLEAEVLLHNEEQQLLKNYEIGRQNAINEPVAFQNALTENNADGKNSSLSVRKNSSLCGRKNFYLNGRKNSGQNYSSEMRVVPDGLVSNNSDVSRTSSSLSNVGRQINDAESDFVGRRFECKECGKTFNTAKSCKRHHRETHIQNILKNVSCFVCGRRFKTRDQRFKHFLSYLMVSLNMAIEWL